jgi:hypothetical protein
MAEFIIRHFFDDNLSGDPPKHVRDMLVER